MSRPTPIWTAAITNLTGGVTGFIEPTGLRVTRKLNGGSTASFSVPTLASEAGLLLIAERALKLWRRPGPSSAAVVRFNGRLWEPLRTDAETVEVTAAGPFAVLENRFVAVPVIFTATDAGAIVDSVLDTANAFESGLRLKEPFPASVARDRTYEPGKQVAEIITQLAEVDGGFFFREDPKDGAGAVLGELVLLYPASGADKPAVRFEYGEGTLANCEAFSIERMLPRNFVTTAGQDLRGGFSDSTSIVRFGKFERWLSFSDVSVLDTLSQHAIEAVEPLPPTTVTMAPMPTGSDPEPPRPFDDFDVGDLVRAKVKHGPIDFSAAARVLEYTIAISDDGFSEQLTSLVLEVV